MSFPVATVGSGINVWICFSVVVLKKGVVVIEAMLQWASSKLEQSVEGSNKKLDASLSKNVS